MFAKKAIMGKDTNTSENLLPDEVVLSRIYLIRGMKVMLDRDLAAMYGVETKRLKEQVRRNPDRFPPDFMFELSKEELENWRSQFATSNSENMGLRHLPFAFTEHGVLMLSSVLNSPRAIAVNIHIMRVYTRLREMLVQNSDLQAKISELEDVLEEQGRSIQGIIQYLKEMQSQPPAARIPIGFGR